MGLVEFLITTLVGILIGVIVEEHLERLWRWFLKVLAKPFKKPVPISEPFHFAFGPIKTSAIIVDGNGENLYLPETIVNHYDPSPIDLPKELQHIKNRVIEGEKAKKLSGETYMWNGPIYALRKFTLGRTSNEDYLELNLWFSPTDWYTFVSTNLNLDKERVVDPNTDKSITLREKFFSDEEQLLKNIQPKVPFSNSFSVNVSLISSDGYLLVQKRSTSVALGKNLYITAINEGAQRPIDADTDNLAPDFYRVAMRGALEELGIELSGSSKNSLNGKR